MKPFQADGLNVGCILLFAVQCLKHFSGRETIFNIMGTFEYLGICLCALFTPRMEKLSASSLLTVGY